MRKRRPVKAKGTYQNVWMFGVGHGHSTLDTIAFKHPAIFPEQLAERHILTWTNPGDLVFDPFVGSGTVPKMARKHDRQWIGLDISQEYIDIATQRLRQTDPMQSKPDTNGNVQISLFSQ